MYRMLSVKGTCQPENGPILPPPPPEPGPRTKTRQPAKTLDARARRDRPRWHPKKPFGRVNPQTHIVRSPREVGAKRGGAAVQAAEGLEG